MPDRGMYLSDRGMYVSLDMYQTEACMYLSTCMRQRHVSRACMYQYQYMSEGSDVIWSGDVMWSDCRLVENNVGKQNYDSLTLVMLTLATTF